MKLRFRRNTLRLRVNRREVAALAAGNILREEVIFPDDTQLGYSLESDDRASAAAAFDGSTIRITAPRTEVETWAADESIGLYFDVPASASHVLKVSIEKDLECVDGPVEERDPDAFARTSAPGC